MSCRDIVCVLILLAALVLFIVAKFIIKSKRKEIFIQGKVIDRIHLLIQYRKQKQLDFSIPMQIVVVVAKRYSGVPFRDYKRLQSLLLILLHDF